MLEAERETPQLEVLFSSLVTDKGTALSVPRLNLVGLPASSQSRPCPVPSPSSAVNKAGDMWLAEPSGRLAAPPLRSKYQPEQGWGTYASQKRPNLPFDMGFLLNLAAPTANSWLSCRLPRAFFQRVKLHYLFFPQVGPHAC